MTTRGFECAAAIGLFLGTPGCRGPAPTLPALPPAGSITAPTVVGPQASDLRASVPAQPGCRFAWSVEGGTMVAGADTDTLTFRAGGGPFLWLHCRITRADGSFREVHAEVPVELPVPLASSPPRARLMEGQALPVGLARTGDCEGVVWRISGDAAEDAGARDTQSDGSGSPMLLAAPQGPPEEGPELRITVAPAVSITAPRHLAPGQSGCVASVPEWPGASYRWEIQGGAVTAGTTGPRVTFTAGHGPALTLRCMVVRGAGGAATGVLVIPVGR